MIFLDPGFQPRNLIGIHVSAEISVPPNLERLRAIHDEAIERVRQIRGVQGAAFTASVPPDSDLTRASFTIEGQVYGNDATRRPSAFQIQASDGYFEVMGIRLSSGRTFGEADIDKGRVAVVNQSAARYLGDDALARRLVIGEESYEVVGVVEDIYQGGVLKDTEPIVYLPSRTGIIQLAATGWVVNDMMLLVRSNQDPGPLLQLLEEHLETTGMTIQTAEMLDQSLWRSIAHPRFFSMVFGVFAAISLLFAAVGLFGVLSHAAGRATREVGLRMALGADHRQIVSELVRRGLMLTFLGIGLGLVGALMLGQMMQGFLYRLAPWDPATFAVMSLVFLVAACLACYIPARRAARIDPWTALRHK